MCIETQSLATALLPKFAAQIGYDVELMRLLSDYQLNPGTETYNAVKNYLENKRLRQQQVLNTFSAGKRLDLNILDYENNLLWSTASLARQDKIVLLYEASEYSQQATEGSAYKKFEDGSEYNLAWVSGGPLFTGGGAFKIGINTNDTNASDPTIMNPANNLTIIFPDNSPPTITDVSLNDPSNNVYSNYTNYTFDADGTFEIYNYTDIPVGEYVPIYYILVGAGATGGDNNNGSNGGGGGGGGGVEYGYISYINNKNYLTYTMGIGGRSDSGYNQNGTASTIAYAGYNLSAGGGDSGSGSGNGNGGTSGSGYKGGEGNYCGGAGGGGAGGVGQDGSGNDNDTNTCTDSECEAGIGGIGFFVNQTGIPPGTYAGGGGGAANKCTVGASGSNGGGAGGNTNSPSGTTGTIGGGGGGAAKYSSLQYGGSGGNGYCILSILSSYLAPLAT